MSFHGQGLLVLVDPVRTNGVEAARIGREAKAAGARGILIGSSFDGAAQTHEVAKALRENAPGIPVALCGESEVGEARAMASEVLGHAHYSPNYVRLLEHGDAEDVGDTMAAGSEATVLSRLQRYRDAGVTDLAARVVPKPSARLGHCPRTSLSLWPRMRPPRNSSGCRRSTSRRAAAPSAPCPRT